MRGDLAIGHVLLHSEHHDLVASGLFLGQGIEHLAQHSGVEIDLDRIGGFVGLAESSSDLPATSFEGVSFSAVIDEDLLHHPTHDVHEVDAIIEIHREVRFQGLDHEIVDESGGLDIGLAHFSSHELMGPLSKLGVGVGQKRTQGLGITRSMLGQQLRDVARIGGHHEAHTIQGVIRIAMSGGIPEKIDIFRENRLGSLGIYAGTWWGEFLSRRFIYTRQSKRYQVMQVRLNRVSSSSEAHSRSVSARWMPILIGAAVGVLTAGQSAALGSLQDGLSAADIKRLQADGVQEGWTFSISSNSATPYNLSELTGLVVPENWREDAPFDNSPVRSGSTLPDVFDWRNHDGENYCTPVRNQAGCGSCWAFALMGSFEGNIRIDLGPSTDLSEQWLVSCANLGGCDGEWPANAARYLKYNNVYTDSCGGSGAVLEADYGYTASEGPCECPFDHPYSLSGWSFVGPEWGTPSRAQLKQAIMDHGPLTVCVTVDDAFQGYTGGIYNVTNNDPINHAVVLVGWDDSQGDNGVWFLRNSWGTGWGEGGYMRIAYGSANIGYNAMYVEVESVNGACCLNDSCLFGAEETCDNVDGVFMGSSVPCADVVCTTPCPADVNGDDEVDTSDILAILAAWDCDTCPDEDIDGSGVVDTNDVLAMISAFGPCD